ncbi:MAG: hypothetical protein K2X29_14640, partial [Candidatus Obscuribacterales bacterium]|nr:hypothetical protein [Candidatus Obscuribacterales bacterium]
MPANHLSISDNRWPYTRRNAGLGSDYTLTFKDDFSREVRFGMAKDGSITSFSQNMANNRLYPGTENGNFLQSLPKLQDLGLIKASNEQLSNVGRLTQLRRLHIHLDDDTTSGAALNKMNRLEDLNLVGGRIS